MVKNAHVTDLFNRILEEVSDEGFDEEHENGNLCREFGEYLRQMPRNITCGQGSIDGELLVSWEDFGIDVVARSLCIRPEWHVVLHRQSICDVKFSQLVGQGMSKSSCGCPQRIVSQTNVSIIDLEHKQKYFPMEEEIHPLPADTQVVKLDPAQTKVSHLQADLVKALSEVGEERTQRIELENKVKMLEKRIGKQKEQPPHLNDNQGVRMNGANIALLASIETDRKTALGKMQDLETRVQDLEDELGVERERVVKAISLANSLAMSSSSPAKRHGDAKYMSIRKEKRAKMGNL
ncbi:hypothetical protein DL95DRAFT_406725 [Leptodontidium sp. 2 PMI_412]|nr:hypothetical protein DL95DRAFT_406725 [Leptodontidium sp. 2 PMI_412]